MDPTFGVGGKAVFDPGTSEFNFSSNIVQQPDGKTIFAGVGLYGAWQLFMLRINQDGSRDTTFGGGVIRHGFAGQRQVHINLQSDGDIVIGGVGGGIYAAQFTADGQFLGRGVFTPTSGADVGATTTLVLDDDSIVVGGRWQTVDDSDTNFSLIKFTSDFQLDTSFGSGGVVKTDFGGRPPLNEGADEVLDLGQDSQGRIIAAGAALPTQGSTGGVVRYLANGALDTSFANGGKLTLASVDFDQARSLVVLPDDTMLLAGRKTQVGNNQDIVLTRVLQDGSIDNSFGSNGSSTFDFGFDDDYYPRMIVLPDGKIHISARVDGPTTLDFGTVMFTANGDLITGVSERDSDVDPTSGRTSTIPIDLRQQDFTVDAGLIPLNQINGQVWNDEDGDGLRGVGEEDVADVTVTLRQLNGIVLATVDTNAAGKYEFVDLLTSDYIVEFVAPTSFGLTLANQGSDDSLDSDANRSTRQSNVVSFASWGEDKTVDAGILADRLTGGRTWEDLNGNGVQDSGEPSVDSVVVAAFTPGGDGILGTPDDTMAASAISNEVGTYHFTNLQDGQYRIVFTPPIDYVPTQQHIGNSTTDSDLDPADSSATIDVLGVHQTRDLDAGFFVLSTVDSQSWNDLNGDGIHDPNEDGIDGRIVELLDESGLVLATTITESRDLNGDNFVDSVLESGLYSFSDLAPGIFRVNQNPLPGWKQTYPLADESLLEDDFDDDTINAVFWQTAEPQVGASVDEINSQMEFQQGGYLVSQEEFSPHEYAGLRISGKWNFTDASLPQHDYFSLLTRSDGIPIVDNETQNGIEFRVIGSDSIEIIERIGGVNSVIAQEDFSIDANDGFEFDIVDDGEDLAFTVTRTSNGATIVLTAATSASFSENRVVIHNRFANGTDTTSYLDDLRVFAGTSGHTLVLESGVNLDDSDFGSQALPSIPPHIDLNGPAAGTDSSVVFTENSLLVSLTTDDATVADLDSLYLVSLSASITNRIDGDSEILSIDTNGTSLTAEYSDGVLTLSGPAGISEFETALRTLAYTNTSEGPTAITRSIQVAVNDGRNNSNVAVAIVDVRAINDSPSVTAPPAISANQGQGVLVGGVSVDDEDLKGFELIEVSITSNFGTFMLASLAGISTEAGANGSSSMTLRGTVFDLNQALATLVYLAHETDVSPDVLFISVSDLGQTGQGGPLEDEAEVDINVVDIVPPTGDIIDISPDPRDENAGLVVLEFSETVTGFDVSDLELVRNGTPVDLAGLAVSGTGSNYSIDLASVTNLAGDYQLTIVADQSGIEDSAGLLFAEDASDSWTRRAAAPPVVQSITLNVSQLDPADLPRGEQPTNWQTQRSDIRSIELTFSTEVFASDTDFALTNLGVNAPVDDDVVVTLEDRHVVISGNIVEIQFLAHELEEGVYQLDILPTIFELSGTQLDGNGDGTPGDGITYQGDSSNKFYILKAEWSGDLGVSVFDFTTFSYWFGRPVPEAPSYVDLSEDDGISVFDFTGFSNNFGKQVTFSNAAVGALAEPANRNVLQAEMAGNIEQVELFRDEIPTWNFLHRPPAAREEIVDSATTDEWESVLELLARQQLHGRVEAILG